VNRAAQLAPFGHYTRESVSTSSSPHSVKWYVWYNAMRIKVFRVTLESTHGQEAKGNQSR
jgi:hypothetical protein